MEAHRGQTGALSAGNGRRGKRNARNRLAREGKQQQKKDGIKTNDEMEVTRGVVVGGRSGLEWMSSRMRQRFDGRQGFLKVNCPRRYSAWKLRVGRWAASGNVRGCDLYTPVNQAMQAREVPVTMGTLGVPPVDDTGWLDQSLGQQGYRLASGLAAVVFLQVWGPAVWSGS